MDINEKILGIIAVLYELKDSDTSKITEFLIKMSTETKEKILLALYKAFESFDLNLKKLSVKTNLIINELEEYKEKKELENFKF